MKKSLIKVIVLISILLCVFSNNFVYGRYDEDLFQQQWENVQQDQQQAGAQDPTTNPGFWKPSIDVDEDSALTKKAGVVLSIINTIGIISAVVVLVLMGIKYMLGSLEEKAEYKKAMIPYIVGIVLLVASTTLPNIIYQIVNSSGFFG